MNNGLVVIDGSIGEGGGQILRTALALSAVLMKPIRIFNIRAKRKNPGLQPQHLTAVRAVATLVDAEVKGAYKGSTELLFIPRLRRSGHFRFNIGTAGSITLVMQATLPVMAFAPEKTCIEVIGGTDVPWSPPIDYVRFVLKYFLDKMGLNLYVDIKRRGHYPRGGGIVEYCIEPVFPLRSINIIKRGTIKAIRGLSHAVKLPKHVAIRQADAASKYLIEKGYPKPLIDIEWYEPHRDKHLGPGSGIVVWALCEHSILGGDSIGARGKPAEKVGIEASSKLVEDLNTGKGLDRYMSDMLIPFLALAKGISHVGGAKYTLHAYTNALIVSRIIGEDIIEIDGELNKPFEMRIRGIGFEPM